MSGTGKLKWALAAGAACLAGTIPLAWAAAGKRIMTDDAPRWQRQPFIGCVALGEKTLQGPGPQAAMDRGSIHFNADGSAFVVTSKLVLCLTKDGVVRLLAGRPELPGFADGPAALARFTTIGGAAPDGRGGLFINDRGAVCIRHLYRKPDGSWWVETVAGVPNRKGRKDGPAREALFADPCNLAANSKGELFTMDRDYLRKIAGGQVVTLNPKGGTGFKDGPLEQARFSLIMGAGAACDGDDNLFVADRWNHRFRKVDFKAGLVSTVAGSGKVGHHEDGPLASCTVEPGGMTWDPQRKTFYVSMVDSADLARFQDGWLKTVIKDCRRADLDAQGNIYAWTRARGARYRFERFVLSPAGGQEGQP